MSSQGNADRPDAFKAMMAAARAAGRPELAHQSRGRALSRAEDDFAEALMAIYGEGISGAADLFPLYKSERAFAKAGETAP